LPEGPKVTGGFWSRKIVLNAKTMIPEAADKLEDINGALTNFRLVAEGRRGEFQGEWNQDAEVFKWIEAASYEIAREGDASMCALLDSVVDLVVGAQETTDGYLHTWHQLHPGVPRYSGIPCGGPDETYTGGHLVAAAVAHHRATGDQRMLEAAQRLVACLRDEYFARGREALTGHPGFEMAVIELYRETGQADYLDLGSRLVRQRGHNLLGTHRYGSNHYLDYLPVTELTELNGHVVAALYFMCGVTDCAMETGDSELLSAARRLWRATVDRKTYVTGGLGAHPYNEEFGSEFELPSESAYCETCAAVAMVMWSWRLLLATGGREYADHIEHTMFNAVLVGLSADGHSFFYDCKLRISEGQKTPARRRSLMRAEWFPLACCPVNVMRLLASWQDYVCTSDQDGRGLRIEQFCCAEIDVGPGTLTLSTEYPWDGEIRFTYSGASQRCETRARIPGWAGYVEVEGRRFEGDYAPVATEWHDGQTVEMRIPMEPAVLNPNPKVDDSRGCLALTCGPLVYCLEGNEEAGTDDVCMDVPVLGKVQKVGRDRDVRLRVALRRFVSEGRACARDASPSHVGDPFPYEAIPFFTCGNARATSRRVWIPRTDSIS
jgi:DUF1680 family protein